MKAKLDEAEAQARDYGGPLIERHGLKDARLCGGRAWDGAGACGHSEQKRASARLINGETVIAIQPDRRQK
ncbi:MAG: hypothetical protein VBE63_03500 [Lamprobacter sp.]|uniref:hypothetical protein n=1 Tax=Lamprobacter sp. TaxID=3100796 RepID=UPI002B25FA78|nr:hypothetical protein [Lamprobacter sp.]MEA3638989.1 hypothetical protein [Lamprobacter sp.]